jgi:hypothetical protein
MNESSYQTVIIFAIIAEAFAAISFVNLKIDFHMFEIQIIEL